MSSSDAQFQAESLVQLLEEGCRAVRGLQLSAMAQALFGVELRKRDLSYDQRRGEAVAIWDPDGVKDDASFTRRQLPRIIQELLATLITLDQPDPTPLPPLPNRSALARDSTQSLGLDRLGFRAETWLTGADQTAYQSEWTFRDRARRTGITSVRLFTHTNQVVRVEPITDTIRAVEPRGVDNYGFAIWLVTFAEPLTAGQPITWGTRRIMAWSTPGDPWLALTVSHSEPIREIEHGTFIVHFDRRFLPANVLRFITPRGSLPDLLGVTQPITIDQQGAARADFAHLQRWMTHGIYWGGAAGTLPKPFSHRKESQNGKEPLG